MQGHEEQGRSSGQGDAGGLAQELVGNAQRASVEELSVFELVLHTLFPHAGNHIGKGQQGEGALGLPLHKDLAPSLTP